MSLNGCQLEGSSRGLVVKYAEDQHKKKELSRLQHLTMNQNNFRGNNGPGGGPQQNMGGMGMGMGGPGMGGPGMGGPGMGGPPNKLRIDSKPDMMNPYFYAQAPHGMHPSGAALYAQPHSPMHLLHSPMNNAQMYMPPSPPSPMHAAAAGMSQDYNQKRMGKARGGGGGGGGGRFNFDMPQQGGAPGGPNGPMGSPSPYGMYAAQQLPPYMTGPG